MRAKGVDQRTFNVEIKGKGNPVFASRSLYYWAGLYRRQLKKGGPYEKLSPVICINLVDFRVR